MSVYVCCCSTFFFFVAEKNEKNVFFFCNKRECVCVRPYLFYLKEELKKKRYFKNEKIINVINSKRHAIAQPGYYKRW